MKLKLPPDSREFLGLLNSHGVKYVVIGGWAVAWHGAPRFTGDIDFFVECTPENAAKLEVLVEEFMPGVFGWKAADFMDAGSWFQMGHEPQRIDILTFASGIDFAEAWAQRVEGEFDGVKVWLISHELLVRNKLQSGRQKDLHDASLLQRRAPKRPAPRKRRR